LDPIGDTYARPVSEGKAAVFWVCGAPGAGKSVAAEALYRALARDGVAVAYVDIDQLGMLYPADDDDPDRHVLKDEALLALLPGYTAAGAQVVVVSGVVDPEGGPVRLLAAELHATLCLLSADPAALRARIQDRGWDERDVGRAMAENGALRGASFIDFTLETAGLSVAQTVEQLRTNVRVGAPRRETTPSTRCSPGRLRVVLVTGPRALASSTAGFALAANRWRRNQRTGFLNLQQLGFLAGHEPAQPDDSSLALTQLAAMHALLDTRSAQLLVVGGHLGIDDRGPLRSALPEAAVTVIRLRADAPTLQASVRDRARGSEARLAGDDLLGAAPNYQAAAVAAAVTEQRLLDAHAGDDHVLDVSARTTVDVVTDIERLIAGDLNRPAQT
jgi:broad-specificity NMP kinase